MMPPSGIVDWVEPNVTRVEALALGLIVAEWSMGGDFVRGYGRTRDEAVANAFRGRDQAASLHVSIEADR